MRIGTNVGGDTGATDLWAVPVGEDEQVLRTRALLGGLVAQAGPGPR